MVHDVGKFDVWLEGVEGEEDMGVRFEYVSGLFKEERMRRWSGDFVNMMKGGGGNGKVGVCDVDVV